MADIVTDKKVDKPEKVTHKRYGTIWKIPLGQFAVGTSKGVSKVGIVKYWEFSHTNSWGCTMIVDGEEFFPDTAECLRPLTKLERALR